MRKSIKKPPNNQTSKVNGLKSQLLRCVGLIFPVQKVSFVLRCSMAEVEFPFFNWRIKHRQGSVWLGSQGWHFHNPWYSHLHVLNWAWDGVQFRFTVILAKGVREQLWDFHPNHSLTQFCLFLQGRDGINILFQTAAQVICGQKTTLSWK